MWVNSAMFCLHFSFVLCFIWKQLKSISCCSAVTKGEKTEMFYIARWKYRHCFILLCIRKTVIITLILLTFYILAKFVSFLKFT